MTLRWVPGWNGLTEPEAVSYVAAVEAADGQDLEFGVARAINDFVVGCKNDGIWDAIKACCILAGARTTNGALVPLVGDAPTPYNFDLVGDTDYNRVTGLKGDGSTKYLDSNRGNGIDPQNNLHAAAYVSATPTANGVIISSTGSTGVDPGTILVAQFPSVPNASFRNHSSSLYASATITTGLIGSSRLSSNSFVVRNAGTSETASIASDGTGTGLGDIEIFRRNFNGFITAFDGRLSFYSIGESLDLEKLDTRVTRLMNLITYTQTAGLPDLATMDIDAAAYIGGGYRAGGTLS